MVRGAKSILYNNNGEVLMLLRGETCHEPGTWAFPGGGLRQLELPMTGALRENFEETHLKAQLSLAKVVFVPGREGWSQTGVPVWVFVGIHPVWESDIVLSEDEEQEYKFFPIGDLPDLTDYSRTVAQGIIL